MTKAPSISINKMSAFFSLIGLDRLLSKPQSKNSNWKGHIDGLRAISILAVLFYHSGALNVSGGFVGVDVFFVISGFLISRIIYGDLQTHGKFRVVDFYERRARRILPTFVFVTAAVLIVGYLIFLPDEFADLGHSAEYASAFAANIYFYHVTGYFGGLAISLPLLHYWSLGVEEQFYIVFPVAAFIICRISPRLLAFFVLGVLGASLVLSEFYLRNDPSAAFYLAGPRAWELMVGSALALPNFPLPSRRVYCEIVAATGLALIAFAAFTYTYSTKFPGLTATVPVIGAALILLACERSATYVGAILSVTPLRYIGLWSYSIYMAHWPIIVFANTLWPRGFVGLGTLTAVTSVLVGCLLYLFVETPFRAPRHILRRTQLYSASLASLIIICSFGAIIFWMQGFPERLPNEVQRILAYDKYNPHDLYRQDTCFLGQQSKWQDLKPICLAEGHPSAFLWGDSHAAHLYAALKDQFPNVVFLQANMSACAPIVGLELSYVPKCGEFNDAALRWVKANRPDSVILSAEWPRETEPFSKLDGMLHELRDLEIPVTIIGETPFYLNSVPKILARRMLRGDYDTKAGNEGVGAPFWGDYYMKDRYSGMEGVKYISSRATFCVDQDCPLATESGIPINWDRDHFTREGAVVVVQHMFRDGLYKKNSH